MTPREVDHLIALKVMGLTLGFGYHDPKTKVMVYRKDNPHDSAPELPRFSEDMNAAWLVASKFMGVQLESVDDQKLWICTLGTMIKGNLQIATSRADSAPMAICIAALKSAGVELPSN